MKSNRFPLRLQEFLGEYLPVDKNYSASTISSYSCAFLLFYRFMEEHYGKKPNMIRFEDVNVEVITKYLQWLEVERGSSVLTRNQRLAAIKSFYKYAIRKEPDLSATCTAIMSIENKKGSPKIISYFTEKEIKLIIDYVHKNMDEKYLVIIAVLYETAVRVSELINIQVSDVCLREKPNIIIRNGKGGKARMVPISSELSIILKKYLTTERSNQKYLFMTKFGHPYSRHGISDFVNRLVDKLKEQYPEMFKGDYHPHSFRHSKATHLYNNGTPLLSIKSFLGHSSITATEIYATPDSTVIRKQIEAGSKKIEVKPKHSKKEQNDILNWLKKHC